MLGSDTPLATTYDVALLDLDGVIYLGERPVPGAPGALAQARQAGMRLAFVTNNASRTASQVTDLLGRMGIPADPAEVITSAHAAAHYLATRFPPRSAVLILGAPALAEAVAEQGLKPVYSADERPDAVVQGFSADLGWRELAEGMVALDSGAFWLAANLDRTIPSPRGALPGNGTMVHALSFATGRTPVATGKPEPSMHAETLRRTGAQRPIVVGDRLDTDIEGARRADCPSLLVLSGVTDAAELLTAPPQRRPDYLGMDVSALLVAQPAVSADPAGARCGAYRAKVVTGGIRLVADPTTYPRDSLDALRALAVASWEASTSGRLTGQWAVTAVGDPAQAALRQFGLTRCPLRVP